MSAHRHQATWRGIDFNRHFIDDGAAEPDDPANTNETYRNNDYYLEMVNLVPVSVQDLHEVRQFLEGSEPNQAFEGSRLIDGSGYIVAPTHGDLEDMTMAMFEAFSPAACRLAFAVLDPPHVGPFQFKLDTNGGTRALRAYCRPSLGRPVIIGRRGEGTVRPFRFRLMAYDPKLYAESSSSTALSDLAGGNNSVNNAGNLATDPKVVIVLSGAGHASFTLTNTTTGHQIIFDLSGLSADTYTLDVNRGTFEDSSGNNVLSVRTSGFPVNMWLAPGNNVVTVTGNTNLTSVTFTFRAAYA